MNILSPFVDTACAWKIGNNQKRSPRIVRGFFLS
jgi:hypothetical protein